MSNKTLVPDKLHGYLLQVIHMLYELISVDDRVVSVEKLDDVAVEIDGKVIAEQLKSVTSANNPIANRASVFWKTLYNWCTYIEDGSLPSDAILRFVVVSNSTVTPGSIQKIFMDAHSDDAAQKALTYAKNTILHTATEDPNVDVYATLPDSYRDYIDVFPYALGAVTPEILAKRKEIERLLKMSERFQRDLDQIKTVAEGWKQEVAGWLTQAYEYGLTNYIANDADEFARQVDELRAISQKRITDASVAPEHVTDLSKDIAALRQEEQQISSELFSARKRHTDMLQLMQSMGKYDKSLQIQLDRLDISTWIRSNMTERNILPIFQPSHENVIEDVNALCTALEQIERSTTEMAVVPAAFEREIQIVQVQIQELADKLEAVQKRIRVESQALAVQREESYTLESISRFLGRIDVAISTYERIGTDSELEAKLDEVTTRIEQLKKEVNESEIRRKLDYALSYLKTEMGKILAQLDVEHPEDPVEFVIKDLTVRVKSQTGRDDYLWEIGSASNWLSYHIALILALQRFFQTKSSVNVPNFIIFDQPSQVYFPRTRNSANETKLQLNDDDKIAVRKIFESLSSFVKSAGFDIQIIVTEHADDDIWGNIPDSCIHLVEKWRNNVKLVPIEWLE